MKSYIGYNQIIDTYPGLTSAQRKQIHDDYKKMIQRESEKAVKQVAHKYEKEVSAMALLALNHCYRYGEDKMLKYAMKFNELMDQIYEFLDGTDISVGAGCFHDLEERFPAVAEYLERECGNEDRIDGC